MKNFLSHKVYFFIVFLLLFACQQEKEAIAPVTQNEETPVVGDIIPGQYIVTFTDSETSARQAQPSFTSRTVKARFSEERVREMKARIDDLMKRKDIRMEAVMDIYAAALHGFSAKLTAEEVNQLAQEPNISIEQDRMMYLEDFTVESIDNANARTSELIPCGIKKAGGSASGTDKTTWVWIVDTGIDMDHPDLNVITESTYAKSFVGGSPNDCNGHGTHVAGIIGAKKNNKGVVGVSAGAPVVPVRVFQCSGGSPVSKVLAGIDHVARYALAGDVMNLSLSGYYGNGCSSSSAYQSAVKQIAGEGTFVAIAAGNDSDNANLYQPACLNGKKIFTVASISCDNSWSYFSNYGSSVDWVATGSDVYSTYKNGGYATLSGTSMATPHVAGILHQRGSAPLARGQVKYKGRSYKIASRR